MKGRCVGELARLDRGGSPPLPAAAAAYLATLSGSEQRNTQRAYRSTLRALAAVFAPPGDRGGGKPARSAYPVAHRSGKRGVLAGQHPAAGMGRVEQDGRAATLSPGDIAFYDSTRPYMQTRRK